MPAPRQGRPGGYLCSHTHPARSQMGAAALWAADCPADGTGVGGRGLTDAVTRSGRHWGHSTPRCCLPPQHRHPSWRHLCSAFFGTTSGPGSPAQAPTRAHARRRGAARGVWVPPVGQGHPGLCAPRSPRGQRTESPQAPKPAPCWPAASWDPPPPPGPPCSHSGAGTPPPRRALRAPATRAGSGTWIHG